MMLGLAPQLDAEAHVRKRARRGSGAKVINNEC